MDMVTGHSGDKPMLYGVWIRGQGWLRGKDVFADSSLLKTQQVARLIGRGAKVLFIDPSIVDLEQRYLEQEQRSLSNYIKWIIDYIKKRIVTRK